MQNSLNFIDKILNKNFEFFSYISVSVIGLVDKLLFECKLIDGMSNDMDKKHCSKPINYSKLLLLIYYVYVSTV